jgi:hypothetical protein
MRLAVVLILSIFCAASCAHGGGQKAQASSEVGEITEDNPGYYEPEMYRKYYDERYENDPAFKKYYEWKEKE